MRRAGFLLAAALLAACGAGGGGSGTGPIQAPENLTLSSPDFPTQLPSAITCAGANRSPRVSWTAPPPTARSLAVELIDPDAASGHFTHWLVYDIPSGARSLDSPLPAGAVEGRNDFGDVGYGGPCPPRGQSHVYLLTIYALELDPDLPAGLNYSDLQAKIRPHVIGMSQLEGTFGR